MIENLGAYAHPPKTQGSNPMSFKTVQASIAKKEGVPMKNAGAILASASRNASPAAKRKNPKLDRVKGSHTPKPMGTMGPHAPGASTMQPAMAKANATPYSKLLGVKK